MDLEISTPGRICLFGEHQDYLQLPVIPCSVSLRITIKGKKRDDRLIYLDLPDINSSESFLLNSRLAYSRERDYFKSVVNVLMRYGFTFSNGFDCVVHGNIPINSGTSSSSALIVTWVNLLARMSDQAAELSRELIAKYAFEAEVTEFNEPGGMMDHYSTAVGGTIFLNFYPFVSYKKFPDNLTNFVLGDSEEPKDTKYILSTVKNQIVDVVNRLLKVHKNFSLHTATLDSIDAFTNEITFEEYNLLKGTIINRDITFEAKKELEHETVNKDHFGLLLNDHQSILRDTLKISTCKINRMIDAALKAGAVGAKINGSGGGGCMFAYAPDNPEQVAEAIVSAGGKSYIIKPDSGTRLNGAGVI